MTYLDFEKEYIKDRPTEPYLENEISLWKIRLRFGIEPTERNIAVMEYQSVWGIKKGA